MDFMKIYSQSMGKKFRKVKIWTVIVFVAACLINPVLNELAFFLAGAAIGALGLTMGLEKGIKKRVFTAIETIKKNDRIHISVPDRGFEVIAQMDSAALQKNEVEGEGDIMIFNSGIIVCKPDST